MASSTAADPARKVSTAADDPAKKVSTDADPAKQESNGDDAVKAGYWFCKSSEFPTKRRIVNLFTHLYAGFAKVQYPTTKANNEDVIIFPEQYSAILEGFPTDVRNKTNGSLKALLSIGGEGPDISKAIASVARDEQLCKAFIKKSIKLARDNKYDGLDLCWLYPSNAEQMKQFASLLKEWRQAINEDATKHKERLLLTAAVFHHPVSSGTEVKYLCTDISHNLDWINVLAIDFYTPSNSPNETGPVHAWLNISDDPNRCGSAGIAEWIDQGVVTQNLVLGLPFYGYKWTLRNHNDHGLFAQAHPANATSLEFRHIQEKYILNSNIDPVYDEDYVATYWYSDAKTWIGFDDKHSIFAKVQAARTDYNLGGYIAWHVGADDDISTLSKEASEAWDSAIYSDA